MATHSIKKNTESTGKLDNETVGKIGSSRTERSTSQNKRIMVRKHKGHCKTNPTGGGKKTNEGKCILIIEVGVKKEI